MFGFRKALISLLIVSPVWAADVWPLTDVKILNHLTAMAHRHPGMLRPRAILKPNFFQVYRNLPKVTEKLQLVEREKDITPEQLQGYSMSFDGEGHALDFNPARIQVIRDWLKSEFRNIKDVNWNRPENFTERQRIAYIALSPLMVKGLRTPQLLDRIEKLDGHGIATLYKRYRLPKRLKNLLSQSGWSYALEVFTNRARKILSEDLHMTDGPTTVMRLEEIPALVAIIRGTVGYDCSLSAVPYYPLHKNVRVFWVYTSERLHGDPDGYLLLAELKVNGRTVPYVITVNGAGLDEIRTKALLKMVSAIYGLNLVIVPGPVNANVVNNEAIRRGLGIKTQDRKSSRVILPQGWDLLTDRALGADTAFYGSTALSMARPLQTDADAEKLKARLSHWQFKNPYLKSADPMTLPLLDRAYLAAYSRSEEIRGLLQVTWEQVEAAKILLREEPISHVDWHPPRDFLDAFEIVKIQRELGLNTAEVLRELDPHTLPNTLVRNFEWLSHDLGVAEMRRWIEKTEFKVRQRLRIAVEQDDTVDMRNSFYFLFELSALHDYSFWYSLPDYLSGVTVNRLKALNDALAFVTMKSDEVWVKLAEILSDYERKTNSPAFEFLERMRMPQSALHVLVQRLRTEEGIVAKSVLKYLSRQDISALDEDDLLTEIYLGRFEESAATELFQIREVLSYKSWDRIAGWLQSGISHADEFFLKVIQHKKNWAPVIWLEIDELLKKNDPDIQRLLLVSMGRVALWPSATEDIVKELRSNEDADVAAMATLLIEHRTQPPCNDILMNGNHVR